MRLILSALFSLIFINTFAQQNTSEETTRFFQERAIRCNTLPPKAGYISNYTCDSMLFLRGDFGDTISIYTPGMEWRHTLQQFKEELTQDSIGLYFFPKYITSNGDIMVAAYHETRFIYRNDSLYQIEDTASLPAVYYDMLKRYIGGGLNDTTLLKTMDSIKDKYKDIHVYVNKLIYAKGMFKNGRKKVRLSKKVNYERDEIELQEEWVDAGRKCFILRINNKQKDGTETSYAYALNEDMKFVWWQQGCTGNDKPKPLREGPLQVSLQQP